MSDPSDLLAALDPEQREVALALRGPVRVLAGAGTGKTRAITHRIAYGVQSNVYAPHEVLAVTFTTRAAAEMRGRLSSLGAGGVQARTFHSAALRQLRYFWPQVQGTALPELIESKLGLLAAAARRQRIHADQALLRDLASEIEWAKVSNIGPAQYAGLAGPRGRSIDGHTPEAVARLFGAYEEEKRSQGRMDMEDVLLLTAGLLAEDERVAAQIRRQYKWFVVDEFQDVSPIQSALLDLWLGGREELCVVGDPAQTIYSFAGADAGYLRAFSTKYPEAVSIELVRNYRSTPQIVDAANLLLAGSPSQGVSLRSQQEPGASIRTDQHADEPAEAHAVCTEIARLRREGVALSQIAVLFRINAQSENFEDALSAAGIPYVVRGASRFFDRAEVREAITRIRGAARSGDGGPLVDAVRGVLAGMGWTTDPPQARGQTRDRWESWQSLMDLATTFAAGPAPGEDALGAFVAELDRRAADQHVPTAEGVTLATFHAAKGLEWDAVFCVGLQEGTLPITYATTPATVEEERRLLYVGLTRARQQLFLSWSLARQPGGRGSRKPSRFLTPLLPESLVAGDRAAGRKGPVKGKGTRTCVECGKPLSTSTEKARRRCAGCKAPYDEDLFDRLKQWRLERSRSEEIAAFMVFSNETLEQIALHRPAHPKALLAISGVGPQKLERYGSEVLGVVAENLGK